jgi:hypothetical protein
MYLFEIIHDEITYILSNPALAVPSVLALIYLLYRKPKIFIILFLLAIASAGVVFLFSKLASLGLMHRNIPFLF